MTAGSNDREQMKKLACAGIKGGDTALLSETAGGGNAVITRTGL